MQVIAVIRRRTEAFSPAEFDAYLEAEAEAVRSFYIAGSIRAIWSREDALGAVLLLECASLDEAHRLIAALPLVQREMAEVEKVVPLRGYRGFGPRQT